MVVRRKKERRRRWRAASSAASASVPPKSGGALGGRRASVGAVVLWMLMLLRLPWSLFSKGGARARAGAFSDVSTTVFGVERFQTSARARKGAPGHADVRAQRVLTYY